MATHDYDIANQTSASFRSDLNNALMAIVSTNSNATAPTTTYANMLWYDTANNQIKKRNEANSAWITLGTIDETAGTFTSNFAPATQAQAEAGTNNTANMTPLRTKQAIDALSVIKRQYISTNQTITTSGLLTLAHSLGEVPKIIFLELVCVTAQAEYVAGDVVMIGINSSTTSENRFSSVYYDATNVYVRFDNSTEVFTLATKNGGVSSALTNANWRLRVRAFA
jgi:hypothetical protein